MSHHEHGHDHRYGHERSNTIPESGFRTHDNGHSMLGRIAGNPKLRKLVILGGIAVLAIVILIIVLLFPLVMKLFGYVSENGLQGVIDGIWKGAKK